MSKKPAKKITHYYLTPLEPKRTIKLDELWTGGNSPSEFHDFLWNNALSVVLTPELSRVDYIVRVATGNLLKKRNTHERHPPRRNFFETQLSQFWENPFYFLFIKQKENFSTI